MEEHMMKKYLIALVSGILALVSCSKEQEPAILDKGSIQASNIVFDLTINYPVQPEATKAVKTGWTSGDMVYLFFEGESEGYVFVTYDGSSWGFPAMHGHVTFTPGGKTLTAVYLPFRTGADPVPTYHDDAWHFSTIRYAYYMCAEKVPYAAVNQVDATKVSATVNMENPDGYVQFFIEDATDQTLYTDALVPAAVTSVANDGTITETTDAGSPLVGYSFAGGKSYSGKLASASEQFFYVYLSDGKTYFKHLGTPLPSHSAVKLPRLDSGRWFATGAGKGVTINGVTWATLNAGATYPWEVGSYYTWHRRLSNVPTGWRIPHATDFTSLTSGTTRYWTSINGVNGYVIVDSDAPNGNFLFLPAAGYVGGGEAKKVGEDGNYWSAGEKDDSYAYDQYFDNSSFNASENLKTLEFSVRPIQYTPSANTLDLSALTADSSVEDRTAKDGWTIFGDLRVNKPIFIADGATVTLDDVSINANGAWYESASAGITCLGDATIVLKDGTTNIVKSLDGEYSGIYVPVGKTLTITGGAAGTGRLTAACTPAQYGICWACGIGAGYETSCGNIVISGGVITAIGGNSAAGIGSAYGSVGVPGETNSACGDITITGGTVTATGGETAPGIGSGDRGVCGDITITNTVTSVTAIKGPGNAPDSIGIGEAGACGTITIGGVVTGRIHESPYTYHP